MSTLFSFFISFFLRKQCCLKTLYRKEHERPTLAAMIMEEPPRTPRMGMWVWAEMKSRIWAMASWSVSSPNTTPCSQCSVMRSQMLLMMLLGSVSFMVSTSTLGAMCRKSSFSRAPASATSLELPTRTTAMLRPRRMLGRAMWWGGGWGMGM